MLTLKFQTSASFRSINKILVTIGVYADLNIKAPSHSTIITWTKKFGLYHIEQKKEKSNDWIIILDESVEFGNEKLLVVLGIREKDVDYTRALQYQDLECLSLRISNSWKGEEIKKVLDDIQNEVGIIKYAIADMGNAIKKSLTLSGIPHVEDLTHKLSWIIKRLYEKDKRFIAYTKKLAHLRGSMALSKISYILPPAQRVHSRFMNLKPIVDWGISVIKMLKGKEELHKEREKLNDILEYEEFLNELSQIVQIAIYIQKTLKNNGLSTNTIKECRKYFIKLPNILKIENFKNEVFLYLARMMDIRKSKKILCSSDILESSFGKYKNYINNNSSIGITALSLAIPAFMNDYCNKDIVINAMQSIKVKDVDYWKTNNIGKTLLKRRNEVLKKVV